MNNDNTATNLADDTTDAANAAAPAAVAKRSAGRPKDPNSRFAQCQAIYVKLTAEGKTRKEILAVFKALPLSEGSAAVYYHEAKKAAAAAATATV